jgi:hypothetical protein
MHLPSDGTTTVPAWPNVRAVGSTDSGRGRPGRRLTTGLAALALVATACGDDETPDGALGTADAVTAIVQWQAIEQEPVLDDGGEPLLPVVYVVAADGETIDVGVQAAVAQAVVDNVVVRFADDASEAFDPDAEGEPVRDDGSLLAIGVVAEPASTLMVDVDRYTAHTDPETLTVRVAERTDFSTIPDDLDPELNRAEVTDVLPR